MRTTLVSTIFSLLATGCFGNDDDSSRGERDRSSWEISDGLCPTLGGACAMDTPVALGASTRLLVRDVDVPLDSLRVEATGSVVVDGMMVITGGSSPPLEVRLTTVAAGPATFALMQGSTEIDRISMGVAAPASMECGLVPPDEGLQYTMENLLVAPAFTVAMPPAMGSEPPPVTYVACRVSDASGEPLLTVRAIDWEVTAGTEVLAIFNEPFEAPGPTTEGARIRLSPVVPGVARLRAQLGALTAELDVTVE